MKLLGAKLYDPAVAVSKSTASLLAMTAFDTTNLRQTVTVPGHGMLRIRMACVITGATTVPTIFLGVLNGSTVVGRVNPQDFPGTMNAATQTSPAVADFIVTGLTPGSITLDAAYGVEVIVASTAIKYGGPNDTTTNNAWGGFQFEIWDPAPQPANYSSFSIDANGRVDVIKVNGTSQTAKDLGAQLDATVSSRLASASYTAPDNTRPANFTSLAITAGGAVTAGTVSDKTGYALTAAYDAAKTAASSADYTAARAAKLDNLDVAVSTRNATAPLDAAGTRTALGLASANLDTQLGALMTSAEYTAPDNAAIAAIQAKTDSLTFTVAGRLDSNVLNVNGYAVTGQGTASVPWGPV